MNNESAYLTPALERRRHWTDIPLLILVIGSLPILALELADANLVELDRTFIEVTNIVVLVAFAVDYLVELVLAMDRSAYVRSEWTSAMIVVTQALAVIPALASVGFLRILRAGRLLRLVVMGLRLVAVGGIAAREGRQDCEGTQHRSPSASPASPGSARRCSSRSSRTSASTAASSRSSTRCGGRSPP